MAEYKQTYKDLKDLKGRSELFFKSGIEKPTKYNFVSNLKANDEQSKVVEFANRAYPIIHAKGVNKAKQFLQDKLEHGSQREKSFYKGMEVPRFIDRLIKKRPLVFMGPNDYWMDKKGNSGQGREKWDPKAEHDMENFITYEEMKISALIQLSTETFLINNGNRKNSGRPGTDGTFVKQGIYVAAVGARFEKPGKMEYQDFVKREKFSSHLEKIPGHGYFDTSGYKDRMKLSFETFLLEAEKRGKNKKVYCHVVGLGLGVWQLWPGQIKHWALAFQESLATLVKNRQVSHISDIDFSWINLPYSTDLKDLRDGKTFPNSNIKIHVSERNPFDSLAYKDEDKLVVAMFAWDGNSYVGNEYWDGMLDASGDPAAASCSFIPELLNPDINLKISGDNLHVACPRNGILSYDKFIERTSHSVSRENKPDDNKKRMLPVISRETKPSGFPMFDKNKRMTDSFSSEIKPDVSSTVDNNKRSDNLMSYSADEEPMETDQDKPGPKTGQTVSKIKTRQESKATITIGEPDKGSDDCIVNIKGTSRDIIIHEPEEGSDECKITFKGSAKNIKSAFMQLHVPAKTASQEGGMGSGHSGQERQGARGGGAASQEHGAFRSGGGSGGTFF